MLTVLFWNMDRKPREAVCARLCREHTADIFAVADCPRPVVLLAELNPPGRPPEFAAVPTAPGCRLRLFARYPPSWLPVEDETTHYTARRLVRPDRDELLLVFVHGRSKLRRTEAEQNGDLRALAAAVNTVESRVGHTRTLLMGDLNADPFQEGVYAADGLHAISARALAGQVTRTVDGTERPFFYNPMWRFLGDAGNTPAGTYFYRKSVNPCRFWHVFDQVLLRPSLLSCFTDEDVAVLTTAGDRVLHRPNLTPDPDVGSHHFPILVRLRYPGG